jgi:hypothetical protein
LDGLPEFRDKIDHAEKSEELLSQNSLAKVRIMQGIFATDLRHSLLN